MREILFRGFHKDENEKKTIYLNGEEIKGKWVYGSLVYKKCFRDNGMVKVYYKEWEEEYAYIYENNIENNIEEYPTKFIEVIPETVGQYTGLNDKNGKEIFERDILKCQHYQDGKPYGSYYKKVKWNISKRKDGFNISKEISNNFEVIGTIFDKGVK